MALHSLHKEHRRAKVAAALVAAAIAAYFVSARVSPGALHLGTSRPDTAAQRDGVAPGSRDPAVPAAPASGEDRSVTEVRDAILRGAMMASPPPVLPAPQDPVVNARETLDERMANAAPNPQNTASMEDALQRIIDSGALQGTVATLVCGSTICRVELSDREDAHLDRASGALAQRAPKMFASNLVYPKGPGERVMYLTTNSAELVLDAPATGPAIAVKADGTPPVR